MRPAAGRARTGSELFRTSGIPKGGQIPPAHTIDLANCDISDPELWRRDAVWDRFARMRHEDPVHWCPQSPFGPYWSITRYDDIVTVDTAHGTFSSEGGITLYDMDEDFEIPMFIAMDAPKHGLQRKAVQPAFSSERLRTFEQIIRSRTAFILDGLPKDEPFDWVARVSIELSTMMLTTLFDLPMEDRRKLARWSDVATGRNNRDICPRGTLQWRAELIECRQHFARLWQERAHSPSAGDLISMLAQGDATKDMSPGELLGNLILLIVGGNDTTRNAMTGGVLAFSKWPDQLAKLRADPSLLPSAVSEIIRWQTPLAHMRRTALQDFELADATIRKGDRVVMWYASGNRDEARFAKPEEFQIDRPGVRGHVSFGFGIHRCLGRRLAELQLRVLWEELLKRFERIEVLGEPSRIPSCFIRGYSSLLVRICR